MGSRAAVSSGDRFNYLTVLREATKKPGDTQRWMHVKCVCGTEKVVRLETLRNGVTKSCGCMKARMISAVTRKHGKSKQKIHNIWINMLQRTSNPNCPAYHRYGARGITVCDRWLAFSAFLEDMGEPEPGMTLERIDNDKGYNPENCRWASAKEQANNTCQTVLITTPDGRRMSIAEAARQFGINRATLSYRVRRCDQSLWFKEIGRV